MDHAFMTKISLPVDWDSVQMPQLQQILTMDVMGIKLIVKLNVQQMEQNVFL